MTLGLFTPLGKDSFHYNLTNEKLKQTYRRNSLNDFIS